MIMDRRQPQPDVGGIRDKAILADAISTLRRFRPMSFRNVDCHVNQGVLTLSGTTKSFYLKQLALTAVRNIEGVRRFIDQIEVCPADGSPTAAPTGREAELRPTGELYARATGDGTLFT
jgi:osmotically-inducible protein OsmY